jgi:small-conductance mechanosensitive channel
LALLVLFGCVAFAQGPEANAPKKTGEELLVAEAQALAERLAELEAALETEAEAERLLETARAELTGVESEEARRVAEEAVADAEESLLQAQSDVATANQLYDSSAERYRIARETQELSKSTGEETIEESSDVPLARLLAQKSRLEESQQEAVLAGLRTAALEDELEALVERQERIRQSLAEVDERLRSRLARERRAEIQDRRSELRVSEDFSERRRQLRVSAALILGALVLLWLCRLAVERFVTEPHRRYQIKKILSLLATLVIGVGLISIFARDLKELVTGVGIFMAGLAIALQEMVSSFFAWFVIRGKRGYRTGDWIRLGDQEGEVVDIGWLVTVLEQVAPLDPDGGGGTQTGGLAFVSNSTIFKGSVVNYTHSVPFLWCSLRYTVTFESDWKRAVALALEVMNAEKEIAQTALVARRKLEHMAAEFAVHMDSTEPRIRTRPGTDGVDLVLRFLAHPRRRRDMLDKINRRILDAVQESENIEFAYRTVRSVRTDAEEDAPASHG